MINCKSPNKKLFSALFSFFVAFMVFTLNQPISACSCSKGDFIETFKTRDWVFNGTVTKRREVTIKHEGNSEWPGIEFEFKISQVWKGQNSATAVIRTMGDVASCGTDFKVGQEYMLLPVFYKGGWHANQCQANTQKGSHQYLRNVLALTWHFSPEPAIKGKFQEIEEYVKQAAGNGLKCDANLKKRLRGRVFRQFPDESYPSGNPITFTRDGGVNYRFLTSQHYNFQTTGGKCIINIESDKAPTFQLEVISPVDIRLSKNPKVPEDEPYPQYPIRFLDLTPKFSEFDRLDYSYYLRYASQKK